MRTRQHQNMSNTTNKKQRLYDLINTGTNQPAKALAKALKVTSVTALVGALRKEGAVIWANKSSKGLLYRFDTVRSYA